MKIVVNGEMHEIPDTARLLPEVLQKCDAKPPFAVALNGQFVPQEAYAQTAIKAEDCLDIVSPIFGG